jgi:hypothetical protein
MKQSSLLNKELQTGFWIPDTALLLPFFPPFLPLRQRGGWNDQLFHHHCYNILQLQHRMGDSSLTRDFIKRENFQHGSL